MELFGISPGELLVIGIVAIMVFGGRLPQVAGEVAATVQKLRRSLNDLRRDSGIDREIANARREFEQGVAKPLREADLAGTVRREAASVRSDFQPSASAASAPADSPAVAAAPGSTPPAAPAVGAPPPTRPESPARSDPRPG
ncbi:MAG: twin-arginine translocase TatA/TatE family subunit [Planctomycetes bacterium]|nr:twin-arginine translocase TatA/TatE family subunit [Planctomycetota bacterium]